MQTPPFVHSTVQLAGVPSVASASPLPAPSTELLQPPAFQQAHPSTPTPPVAAPSDVSTMPQPGTMHVMQPYGALPSAPMHMAGPPPPMPMAGPPPIPGFGPGGRSILPAPYEKRPMFGSVFKKSQSAVGRTNQPPPPFHYPAGQQFSTQAPAPSTAPISSAHGPVPVAPTMQVDPALQVAPTMPVAPMGPVPIPMQPVMSPQPALAQPSKWDVVKAKLKMRSAT